MVQKVIRSRVSVVVTPMVTALVVASTFIAPAAQSVVLAASAPAASSSPTAPASCTSLTSVALPNMTINSAVNAPSGQIPPPLPGFPPTPVVATCRVHATVTTPGAGARIGVDVWTPVSGWNGRFQGVGGSGFVANDLNEMAAAVDAGYSAAGTDAGHTSQSPVAVLDGSFALDSNGRLNWTLIEDFAYRGVHDLAVVGKAVTAAYYGSQAKFAYWNGCSTGGRQGMAEASAIRPTSTVSSPARRRSTGRSTCQPRSGPSWSCSDLATCCRNASSLHSRPRRSTRVIRLATALSTA